MVKAGRSLVDKRLTALPPPGATFPFLEVFQPDLCLVQLCLAHASGTPELDPAPWLGGSFPHRSQETALAHSILGQATLQAALLAKGIPHVVSRAPLCSGRENLLHQHHSSCSHNQTHQVKREARSST